MFAAGPKQDELLPRLRDELQIKSVGLNRDGAPSWVIYDPVRHAFFKVSKRVVALLNGWRAGTVNKLQSTIRGTEGFATSPAEIAALSAFLIENELTRSSGKGASRAMLQRRDGRSSFSLQRTLQSATFFRYPLFHPAPFLDAALPFARPFFSRISAIIALICGVLGILLLSQQWGLFLNYGSRLIVNGNPLLLPLTLAAVMTLHELGHAFQATMRGVRVSSIGFALMVFAPLLYTDVSDAWRLSDRRDRLFISLGGVLVDLWLAMLALFTWSIVPDGIVRDAAFLVATTSLFLSIFVNLNPLLRFDGYYVLADMLGQDNLHPRAAKRAIEWIRSAFFGIRPTRERILNQDAGFLITFGIAAYLYRLLIMTVIVALVYVLFGPVFGALAAIAVLFLNVVKPLGKEVFFLVRKAGRILRNLSGILTVSVLFGGLLFLAVPLPRTISAPAILLAADQHLIFPPSVGQVEAVFVRDGDAVEKGQTLVRLSSTQIDAELSAISLRIDLLRLRLSRIAAHNKDRVLRNVLESQLEAELSRRLGAEKLLDQLVITAPSSGQYVDAAPAMAEGSWIDRTTLLGRVISRDKVQVFAMAPEIYVDQIVSSEPVTFYASDISSPPTTFAQPLFSEELVQDIRPPRTIILTTGDIKAVEISKGVHRVQDEWRWINTEPTVAVPPGNPQVGYLMLRTKPISRLRIIVEHIAAKIVIFGVSR